jgi:ribosomal protein S12 methylthiotransferase RimO
MLGKLADHEMTDDTSEADVIIVNTCGFIDAAKEESINTTLSLNEERKEGSTLVMAGCLSERYKEELQQELKEVDVFTGVGDYDKIDQLIAQKSSSFTDSVYLIDHEERVITGSNYHAYIKIAEGCNQSCSFCAIPSFKGKLHSRTLESIVKEITLLTKKGFYDFSFVSQDSSSYLRDLGQKDGLIELIDAVEKIDGVKSARILYLYPSTTSHELIDRIGSSTIFHNYFDMPMQHSSDAMLQLMKRGFGADKTIALLEKMRALPDSFVRTSFIVGHPSETEDMFNEMNSFVQNFGFDRVNVFAYSDEEGTKAHKMSAKVPDDVINDRLEVLGESVNQTTLSSLDQEVGQEVDIVIDGISDEHEYLLSARKLLWAPEVDGEILVNDANDIDVVVGRTYRAIITEVVDNRLLATLIKEL